MTTGNANFTVPAGAGPVPSPPLVAPKHVSPDSEFASPDAIRLELERKYSVKLEDWRQAVIAMTQSVASREGVLADRLDDAHRTALQMFDAAGERLRALSKELLAAQESASLAVSAYTARELEVAAQIRAIRDDYRARLQSVEMDRRESMRRLTELHDSLGYKLRAMTDRESQALAMAEEMKSRLIAAEQRLAGQSQAAAGRERDLRREADAKAAEVSLRDQTIADLRSELSNCQNHASELQQRVDRVREFLAELRSVLVSPCDCRRSGDAGILEMDQAPRDFDGLLALTGRDFVTNAYRMLLRREPDPDGLAHHVDELRRGTSRLELLRRIRYSTEGRRVSADIRGIRMRLAIDYLYRISVIGWIAGAIKRVFWPAAARRESAALEYALTEQMRVDETAYRETQDRLLEASRLIEGFAPDTAPTGTTPRRSA